MINIEDFIKVELLVGTIEKVEEVPESGKMLKMEVNLGKEKRQVLAGVKKFFKPEDLIGKQGVFVVNLEPRRILGLESQGMMLFAKDQDGIKMVTIDGKVEDGTRLS